MSVDHDILLETGTNEVEILEFFLDDQSFGVNVAKVMQIVAFDPEKFTATPEKDTTNLGVFLWHGKTIPLIDLNHALNRKAKSASSRPLVLVTRFNLVVNGFMVSAVNRIHRIGWEMITATSSVIGKHSSNFTGSVHVEDREILLVDFEYIVARLFPETRMSNVLEVPEPRKILERQDVNLIFAEDSVFIRESVSELLHQIGYRNVMVFEDGLGAYEYIQEMARQLGDEREYIAEFISLVVTDIEMPKMDGLTLCKRIKKEMGLSGIKVAIFSSLVDEQMAHKCHEVGADVYTTKPQIGELVNLIDRLLRIGEPASAAS